MNINFVALSLSSVPVFISQMKRTIGLNRFLLFSIITDEINSDTKIIFIPLTLSRFQQQQTKNKKQNMKENEKQQQKDKICQENYFSMRDK